ncbi:phosphoserine phosphatase SerB [bacterium]|nr:phosphoserine phosphatase SerB [bacterium]
MYIVTIISNPNVSLLDLGVIKKILSSFETCKNFKWLMPKVAAEFEIPTIPVYFEEVWKEYQTKEIDLTVQRSFGRKKKVLIADMDSTMIHQECINELAFVYEVGDEVSDITQKSMNGDIDFENALRQRVALLKGMKKGAVEAVLKNRISLVPGGKSLVNTMRHSGCYTALVSGGFTLFANFIGCKLGFNEVRANELLFENEVLNGLVREPILGKSSKLTALIEISRLLGVNKTECIAVGDGANDITMISAAGVGVAFHAKPIVQEVADVKINFGDLTSLLFLQGYTVDEFYS